MGWWFGRKSAPADARPFVPAWLNTDSQEVGFARSIEGMAAYVRSTSSWAIFRESAWELGIVRGSSVVIDGDQVIGSRVSAIAGPSGGATVDSEARTAIDQILGALRQHGLIET